MHTLVLKLLGCLRYGGAVGGAGSLHRWTRLGMGGTLHAAREARSATRTCRAVVLIPCCCCACRAVVLRTDVFIGPPLDDNLGLITPGPGVARPEQLGALQQLGAGWAGKNNPSS